MKMAKFAWVMVLGGGLTFLTGCPRIDEDAIEEIAELLEDAIDADFQRTDPRFVTLPPRAIADGNTVIIDNSVTIIEDPRQDIIVEELPDVTIVGIENLTGLDALITYEVDDPVEGTLLQRVFVFDGEALLLEYFCLDGINLVSEEYYDPFTGEFVDAFDTIFPDGFIGSDEFACGEAVILTFDVDGVFVGFEPIDLLR